MKGQHGLVIGHWLHWPAIGCCKSLMEHFDLECWGSFTLDWTTKLLAGFWGDLKMEALTPQAERCGYEGILATVSPGEGSLWEGHLWQSSHCLGGSPRLATCHELWALHCQVLFSSGSIWGISCRVHTLGSSPVPSPSPIQFAFSSIPSYIPSTFIPNLLWLWQHLTRCLESSTRGLSASIYQIIVVISLPSFLLSTE